MRFQQCGMWDQQSLRSACAYAQSDQSLCKGLEYSMTLKLLTKHHLEFISLKEGCTGLDESTLVKMPHCWNSDAVAQLYYNICSKFACQKNIGLMDDFGAIICDISIKLQESLGACLGL